MSAPRMLDLFSGAGGCARGYMDAGFHVTGVDVKLQPNYCGDRFIQADALDFMRDGHIPRDFDAVSASPPCQHYAGVTAWRGNRDDHPDLIAPVRELLEATGLPYVIENVPDARHELRRPVTLCGEWFGLRVRRHRLFETNWPLRPYVARCRHANLLPFEHKGERAYADAMGCQWMTSHEAREAVPPVYTAFIGAQLRDHLRADTVSVGAPGASLSPGEDA